MFRFIIERVQAWGEVSRVKYGVDPWIFFILSVASALPFYLSLFMMLKAFARKNKRRVAAWAGVCLFIFISPWFYVLLFGRNLPWWIALLIALLVGWCLYSLAARLRKKSVGKRQDRP